MHDDVSLTTEDMPTVGTHVLYFAVHFKMLVVNTALAKSFTANVTLVRSLS